MIQDSKRYGGLEKKMDITWTTGSEIGQLSNCKTLIVSYNELSGSIPTELGLLTELTLLSMDSNGLMGR